MIAKMSRPLVGGGSIGLQQKNGPRCILIWLVTLRMFRSSPLAAVSARSCGYNASMAPPAGENLKAWLRFAFRMGGVCRAEVHWYEAHGKGKKKMKIKKIVG